MPGGGRRTAPDRSISVPWWASTSANKSRNLPRNSPPRTPTPRWSGSTAGRKRWPPPIVSYRFSRAPRAPATIVPTNRSSPTTAPLLNAGEATDEPHVGRDSGGFGGADVPRAGDAAASGNRGARQPSGSEMAAAAVGGVADGAVGDRVGSPQFAGGPLGGAGVPGAVRRVACVSRLD